ncbi:3-deoxy-manno-octulosonate cytidylyltransferase [Candidatus Zixiibacteriota bacterium]|nr:3-deoxy-manno-octulosonate cytidylyltransferase [candidate division Zixibacteria bacterium]
MKPRILAVIPARYSSRRFPGKPLSLIAGKSLFEHLYTEVSRSKLIGRVVVATDDKKIYSAARAFGGEVVLTSSRHRTGSDRSAEVLEKLGGDIIVSIQADHLGVKAADYDKVLKAMLAEPPIEFATMICRIDDESTLFDPNRVKVIADRADHALWFSRYPLPYLQGIDGDRLSAFPFYYHIGVYFFRAKALKNYHLWKPGLFEKAESLEQLRILENRRKIKVFRIKREIISIDTPEDLQFAETNIFK